MQSAAFTSGPEALTAILAGKAKITLVSKGTGTRFTYRICRAEARHPGEAPAYFVSLLSGPNNESDFVYLGMLRKGWGNEGYCFHLTAKSRSTMDAASVKAISWAVATIYDRGEIPASLEVWHEGCCCRCGRTLTVPESLATGLGPECAKKGSKAAPLLLPPTPRGYGPDRYPEAA